VPHLRTVSRGAGVGGGGAGIRGAERLMDRYGKQRLYFIFPDMSMRDAETLLNRAEARWK
jgi:hypothetical protein